MRCLTDRRSVVLKKQEGVRLLTDYFEDGALKY